MPSKRWWVVDLSEPLQPQFMLLDLMRSPWGGGLIVSAVDGGEAIDEARRHAKKLGGIVGADDIAGAVERAVNGK